MPPENIVAVRWLDQGFEPTIGAIPPTLVGKLQAPEIFHQLLEHRWFESERLGRDVTLEEALATYVPDVLAPAPDEHLKLGSPTAELFLGDLGSPHRPRVGLSGDPVQRRRLEIDDGRRAQTALRSTDRAQM